MILINWLGWTGNLLYLLGVWLLANKRVSGFVSSFFANILYFIMGLLLSISSIWMLSIGLGILNIIGIVKWRRK